MVGLMVAGVVGVVCFGEGLPVIHESQRLAPEGAAYRARFGCSAAWWGNQVAVGAYAENGSGEQTGAVYLYDGSDWSVSGQISPEGLGLHARFGRSVAMNNRLLAVGSGDDLVEGMETGAVFLYDRLTAQPVGRLEPEGLDDGDWLGTGLLFSGDTLFVCDPFHADMYAHQGAVFVFDSRSGEQVGKLLPEADARSIGFGASMDVHGSVAVIGAPYDNAYDWDSGTAYLFDLGTGERYARIEPATPQGYDFFGGHVAVGEHHVLITSERGWTGSGAVDVFDPRDGSHMARILPPEGIEVRRFGLGSDISGRYALVYGIELGGGGEDYYEHVVYLYDMMDYRPLARLKPSDAAEDRELHASPIGFRGTQAVVGSALDGFAGAMYVFDLDGLMCVADRVMPYGRLDVFDVAAYVEEFLAGEASADLAEPVGVLDFWDLRAFLGAFGAGCGGG